MMFSSMKYPHGLSNLRDMLLTNSVSIYWPLFEVKSCVPVIGIEAGCGMKYLIYGGMTIVRMQKIFWNSMDRLITILRLRYSVYLLYLVVCIDIRWIFRKVGLLLSSPLQFYEERQAGEIIVEGIDSTRNRRRNGY